MAPLRMSMVTGSVEGVSTAPARADPSTTQRQLRSIVLASISPRTPSTSCSTGSWNASPVASSSSSTKSRYFPIDHRGSTTSAP